MITRQRVATFLLLGFTLIFSRSALCQTPYNSSTASVALTATLGETITISATQTASFTLTAGQAAQADAPVSITTTWVLAAGRAHVELDAYFMSATAALADASGHNIPSTSVLGEMTSGRRRLLRRLHNRQRWVRVPPDCNSFSKALIAATCLPAARTVFCWR